MPRLLFVSLGAALTLLLVWFAARDYRDARPMAEENLLGLAHSLAAAIGNSVRHDPTLKPLATFNSRDIAYFALMDAEGTYRFHSNEELVGTRAQEADTLRQLSQDTVSSVRLRLATGEEAFVFLARLPVAGSKLWLKLVLHTYRADHVVRRARINVLLVSVLIVAGWGAAFVVSRFYRREQALKQEMARRANLALLGEMGATLAHEIRNPLAGIKGFAQLIERQPDGRRTRDSAERIVTETKRLEALVDELLLFAGSGDVPFTLLTISSVVEQVAGLIAAEAEQLNIAVICDEVRDADRVIGCHDRLVQLLLNICKNSLQAMPDGGTLRITAGRAGRRVQIIVTDTGPGIGSRDLPRVFEPFFTTRARGTGMGLAVCRKIAEEHHGEISMASSDTGTVVTVSLPAADAEVAST